MPKSSSPAPQIAVHAPPEPGLRERKKAKLRARIAETALATIRELGLERTTVDEICRRVEISQPTFYKYFPTKESILAEHAMIGWSEVLTAALDAPGNVESRLRACFDTIATRMQQDGRVWHAIALSGAYNPIRDPGLLHSSEAGTRALERLLAQGQQRGELTRDFGADRQASMLEGLMLRVGIEWGAGYLGPRPLSEAMREALGFFLRAASAAPDGKPTRARGR